MDPKDRIETVVKTKAGAQQEKAGSGSDSAPGAQYTVSRAEVMLNRESPYTEGVLFGATSESDTGYLDDPVMKEPTLHQGVEKVKDVLGLGNDRG